MNETIQQWYAWGLWTADMVREAVPALLTEEEANQILQSIHFRK